MKRVPRLLQESIDRLVEKSKREPLTRREQAMLDEALLYLADLWVHQLERRAAARTRHAV